VDLGYVDIIWFCNFTTIIVCSVNKIPQLLTLYKTKSPVGVSVTGVIFELFGYCISYSYNVFQEYPLSTYMEYPFLLVQDVVLILYIFYLLGQLDVLKFGALGLLAIIFYGFIQGIPHPSTLQILIKLVAPISASSKLVHLKEIWTTRNSESVSVPTWLIAAYSCATRIVTTLMTTGDGSLLTNYFTAFFLNLAIIGSALYFKERNPPKEKKQE